MPGSRIRARTSCNISELMVRHYIAKHSPLFEGALVFSFCLIVGELQFIFTGLLIVCVTCIATPVLFQKADRDKLASSRDVKDLSRHADLLGIKGVGIIELHPIERLGGGPKGFPNLTSMG